jgi:hypothetical protein
MRNGFPGALVMVIVFVGCNRAFTEDIAFNAPPGWVYSAVPFGRGETWVKAPGSHERIMAQRVDTPLPQQRPPEWKNILICGGHDAVLMVDRNNRDEIWEAVSTTWGSHRYMAVYERPTTAAPDRQAEKAIRSLCLRKS